MVGCFAPGQCLPLGGQSRDIIGKSHSLLLAMKKAADVNVGGFFRGTTLEELGDQELVVAAAQSAGAAESAAHAAT
jgi:hypothetical protein